MKKQLRPQPLAPGTVSRRRWRASENEYAVASGVIPENERIELIDGEVVVMAAKGRAPRGRQDRTQSRRPARRAGSS